jgi:hypothetical protein
MKYVIISYKHSSRGELTFWRPNNAGYTTDIDDAGRYTQQEVIEHQSTYNSYHEDQIDNVAVPEDLIAKLFRTRKITEADYRVYNALLGIIQKGGLVTSVELQDKEVWP